MKLKSLMMGLFLAFCCIPYVSPAQSVWSPPAKALQFQTEFLKYYSGNNVLTGFTGAWFFTGVVPLGRRFAVVGDLPVAHTAQEQNSRYNETVIGNPSIGMQFHATDSPLTGAFGLRIPVYDPEFFRTGPLYQAIDRYEAFRRDHPSVNAAVQYDRTYYTGLIARMRLSAVYLIDNDKDTTDDSNELIVRYAALALYDESHLQVGGGISGGFFLGDQWQSIIHSVGSGTFRRTPVFLGDRHYSFFTMLLGGHVGRAHPSLEIRLPITSELRDRMDVNLGFGVAMDLK